VVVPVTKTWEELAKEAGGDSELAKKLDGIAEGERASMGGPVDAEATYREWMEEQGQKAAAETDGIDFERFAAETPMSPTEFWERYNDFLETAKDATGCNVPIETRILTEAEIAEFAGHRKPNADKRIAGFYDPDAKIIVFNEVVHKGVYNMDYSGRGYSNNDGHERFSFTMPEGFQARIFAHELAHAYCPDNDPTDVKKDGHGELHKQLMFEYLKMINDYLEALSKIKF
jgi:hypothetical protein